MKPADTLTPGSLTPAELLAANAKLVTDNQLLQEENNWLRAQFNLAQHKLYGVSSERTELLAEPEEVLQNALLFNEAEAQANPELPEPTVEEVTKRRPKATGRREAQLAGLPVEQVRHELPEEEQVCPHCAGHLHEMGQEVRREIKIIPAQASVVEHLQIKYACRHCAQHDIIRPPLTAPMPKPAFPYSLASPSAVAYIMTQKYDMALPLYRQEQGFQDLGLELSRQTMANWMIKGADLLNPVYGRLHQELLTRDILHADETVLQVLHELGRKATTQSRMWVYCTGRAGPDAREGPVPGENPSIILYEYQPTRSSDHPIAFLKGFGGFLQTDGYISYEKVPDITLVGCWAHARRNFVDAINTLPPKSRAGAPCAARIGLTYCDKLFRVERELRETTPEKRYAGRQAHSLPTLNEFHTWLEQQAGLALPKSKLGEAIGYCLNQWPKLIAFLQDGRLELDNNRCERAVKPFVIGRKNWLFSNTVNGARASAIIYSIVETARASNLRPLDYLTLLFERLPNLQSGASLDELLPWSGEVQALCGSSSEKTA